MKQALLIKFNENLADLNEATGDARTWFYAYAKGFLSALFELPDFTQAEFDDLCSHLDTCMFGGSLHA